MLDLEIKELKDEEFMESRELEKEKISLLFYPQRGYESGVSYERGFSTREENPLNLEQKRDEYLSKVLTKLSNTGSEHVLLPAQYTIRFETLPNKCDIEGCEKPVYESTEGGNWCEKHNDDYFAALDNASVS